MTRPPRFAYSWLVRCLPPGEIGASIRGDLQEEFELRKPGQARTLWYVGVAARLAIAYGVGRQLDRVRGRRITVSVDAWMHDLRAGYRSVLRQRRYLASTVVTLALGIGANTAIFSILYGAVWRPLPYGTPDRLVRIADRGQSAPPTSTSSMSVPNFLDMQRASQAVEQWAGFQYRSADLSESGAEPRRVLGMTVTPGFFDLLGVAPARGRALVTADAEEGSTPVVILSHGLWQDYYGGNEDIIGRMVRLDREPHMVIGVAPADFDFPAAPRLWTPLVWPASWLENRRWRRIDGIGRLRAGVTAEAARAELTGIFAELEQNHPEANRGWTVTVLPLKDWIVRGRDRQLLLFGGAVLLVLLIAAANATNLMIARAETRAHEMAIRAAMGAGRGRLSRLLAVEGVGVALFGGAAGVLAAYWGVRSLTAAFAPTIPRATAIDVNPMVLGFSIMLSLILGAGVGIIAARKTRRDDALVILRSGGRVDRRESARFRRSMIVTEIAVTMVLATGAALMTSSVWRLRNIDLGVDPRGVLTAEIRLPIASYPEDVAAVALYQQLIDRLEADPAVVAAAFISRQPLRGGTNGHFTNDRMTDTALVEMRAATPHTFRALGIQLQSGQTVDRLGTSDGGRVVVNRAFARELFGIHNVVGRTFRAVEAERTFEIVGVVSDLKEFGPTEDARPTAYWAMDLATWGVPRSATIIVRGAADPRQLVPLLRNQLTALDASLPLAEVAPLQDLAAQTIGPTRRAAFTLLGLFAVVGIVLGALGIYSVIAFTVESRTREMGIRMALGATASRVTLLVLWDGVRLTLLGVVIGLFASVALTRTLRSLLYGVEPTDPGTLLAVSVTLAIVAIAASLTPALRAAGMPVSHSLRAQ